MPNAYLFYFWLNVVTCLVAIGSLVLMVDLMFILISNFTSFFTTRKLYKAREKREKNKLIRYIFCKSIRSSRGMIIIIEHVR